MALFSRRTLDRVLNENAAFLTKQQCADACSLLNSAHDRYLATEWEQIVLNAASKLGTVQHEPQLGRSRPDVLFRSSNGECEFIADITTASDQGFDDLNPVDPFFQEFERHLRKGRWLEGGFDVRIDPQSTSFYRGSNERVRLKLPSRSRWNDEIFNSTFRDFLRGVRDQPEQVRRFDAISEDAGVHIAYDPRRRGTFGTNHLLYTIATSLDRNPVYTALKAKGDQLKATDYRGMRGVVLCDGGCQMLSAYPHWSSFTVDDVIRNFLRQFDSVWFVLVLAGKDVNSHPAIQPKLYLSQNKRHHDFSLVTQILEGICKGLPELQFSPYNARYRIKAKDLTGRYYGVLQHGGSVKMSARELLEILAGVKSVSDFEKNYRLTPDSNPFRRMLAQGRLIKRVSVEHIPERDDDEVTIEFGEPDAAVAAFRVVFVPRPPDSNRKG